MDGPKLGAMDGPKLGSVDGESSVADGFVVGEAVSATTDKVGSTDGMADAFAEGSTVGP